MKKSLLILLIVLPLQLLGQGISDSIFHIQQVRVTSSKKFIKEEAGMKETSIDSMVLLEQVNLNLSDLLSENTLIHMKDYGRGALSTASFRGASASHTQVSWNGLNINSPMLGMVDFSLIPIFILDDVSIRHNGASVSSQGGGIGGMIQLENKADWQNRISGKFYQDLGFFSTFDEFAQINIGNQKIQSKTRIYHNYSANDYEFTNRKVIERDPETGVLFSPTQKNSNAGYRKTGFTQELYFRASSRTIVDAQLWFQDAERAIPTVHSNEFYGEIGQLHNQQNDRTLKAVANISHYGNKIKYKFRSGVDYQQMGYFTETLIGGLDAYKPVNSGLKSTSWNNFAEAKWDANEKLSLKSNFSYNYYVVSTLDTATQSGYDIDLSEASFFGGVYYAPLENLQLAAQVRKIWFGSDASPLIYTAGLNYQPGDAKNLILKGNFSRNYHHPTLNDLYWQPGGNQNLLPEEGNSGEFSVLYKHQHTNLDVSTECTAFLSNINNWIIWLPSLKGYWIPENIRNVKSYGIEYSFTSKYTYKKTVFKTNGNVSLSKTTNTYNNQQLPYIPMINGNIFISVYNRGYYLNFQHNTIGRRSLLSSNDNFYSLYPHFLNKAAIGKSIDLEKFDLNLELKVTNLFNEEYRNILQRFMPGRHYLLMLKVDF